MNILDAALAASWAMEEQALAGLLDVAAREHQVTPEALAAYRADSLKKAERASVRDGVAILSVDGPLFKKANLMTELCGATSYATLMHDLQVALDDSNVRAILFNVDSPGGEASGVGELATAIRAARGKKPIVAYAGDLAASAAYWIASAADRIVIGQGAALGSIGVRASIPDTRERDARSGVRRHEFVSSQSPYKVSDPATKDGRERIKSRVDALAQVFVDAVAANRGVSTAHVLDAFGKGDVLVGQAAVAAGMADGFGTFESVLASLVSESDPLAAFNFPKAAASGNDPEHDAMTPEQIAADRQAAVDAALAAERTAAEARQAEAVAAAQAAATASAQTVERERVAGIHAASFAGYDAERDEAIRSGSSVADFKALLVDREHAKAAERAKGIGEDVDRNSGVRTSPKTPEKATGDEAAAQSVLSAFRAAMGQ
jgi:signal peptide peptidase SppA